MKTVYFVCKHCGCIDKTEIPGEGADEMCELDSCHACHDKLVVEEAMSEHKSIDSVIRNLNRHLFCLFEDGPEDFGSTYNFVCKVEHVGNQTKVIIYDEQEAFNINLDDEIAAHAYYAAKEFGWKYKRPNSKIDEVKSALTEAIEKDFKATDVVLEWEDGVVMSAWF